MELKPEQQQAIARLKDALTSMYDSGLGSDAIHAALEEMFPQICNEMAGGVSDRSWRRNTDPYFYRGSAGAARFAEASIVRSPKE